MDMPPAFDIPLPEPRAEPTPRWIRVRAGGEWVADSRQALLLNWFGPGRLPTYCFPEADVLEPGRAQRLENLPEPVAAAEGMWTFPWDGSVRWFEEATEVFVHPRDPQHRVDAVPSERHVRVAVDGELLAETGAPVALFETGLPTRWYLPREDVRQELLEASDTVTRCPYKGTAGFWSVRAAGVEHGDLCWSYPDPIPECQQIAELVAFFNEHVDLTVDGEALRRPFTPWSLSPRA